MTFCYRLVVVTVRFGLQDGMYREDFKERADKYLLRIKPLHKTVVRKYKKMEKRKHISFENAGKKLPFTVPENYFENFALQMDGQIMAKPVPVYKLLRPWLYVAAMILGVFFLSRIGYNIYQEKNDHLMAENYDLYIMSQVDETEIIDYYLTEETK